uniref:(northern house mosquito) hypothetical protein n=1 Tax=Culex pipiens TaxID=7175 RepID=A0A8D8FCR0_CULPI
MLGGVSSRPSALDGFLMYGTDFKVLRYSSQRLLALDFPVTGSSSGRLHAASNFFRTATMNGYGSGWIRVCLSQDGIGLEGCCGCGSFRSFLLSTCSFET